MLAAVSFGTVAILAAVGMQAPSWSKMVPEHLYHIVAALHRVGLDPEARMIAADCGLVPIFMVKPRSILILSNGNDCR